MNKLATLMQRETSTLEARVDRRQFIGALGLGLGASALCRVAPATTLPRSRIEVLLNEPRGTISPDLYGYLIENLGTVVYDGIWVGERSGIANIGGIRRALVEHLRQIKASILRWPGGNFADYYDWKDGIGPRASRPRRTNMWSNEMPPEAPNGPQRYDPNQFGTPEFMSLCKLTGGRPYLNVNVRGLPAQEFARWVEYCNSPPGTTTLADQRKANGSNEPYGVRYWGIGNEPWGAGGPSTVEEYASLYKRFTNHVPNYGQELTLIAAGAPPPGSDHFWVREFLRICKSSVVPVPLDALSIHYYATFPPEEMQPGQTFEQYLPTEESWLKRMSDSVAFNTLEYYDLLDKSARMDSVIQGYWDAMAELDATHQIKIAVDEWGSFCKPGQELSPANIRGRAVTLRDALAAAITLDVFQHHANKLLLANFTGLINQEGGLFRAEGAKFVATPIYHVFKLYAAHQGGQALRTIFDTPQIRLEHEQRSISLQALSGSASLRGRELTLTVVNSHASEPAEAVIAIQGGTVLSGMVDTLTHSDIHAQNTFEAPDRVRTVTSALAVGSAIVHQFPPASVSRLTLRLSGT